MLVTDLIVIAAVAIAVALIAIARAAYTRRRDARLAARWDALVTGARAGSRQLAFVRRVYQRARTGSKAELLWLRERHLQDAWFKDWHVPTGVYLELTGSTGYGRHNNNPRTFYVEQGQVFRVIPANVRQAWERHQKRTARRARRTGGGHA